MSATQPVDARFPSASSFLYLASQSPRRRQLLDQIGVAHRLLPPGAHEDAEALEAALADEEPAAYACRVARLKLDAAVARRAAAAVRCSAAAHDDSDDGDGARISPDAQILCADTTVALGRTLYGKPRDAADAARMLRELSGRTHRVITAIALHARARRLEAVSESLVTFAAMSDARIDAYVGSREPFGKAGAYAVQGRAAAFIARIEGSYSGIMGLPLFETAQLLRAAGFEPG